MKPLFTSDLQDKILNCLISGQTVSEMKTTLGVNHNDLYLNLNSDRLFKLTYEDALTEGMKNRPAKAEFAALKKRLAEFEELIRWRLTEMEPPPENGRYEVFLPNGFETQVFEIYHNGKFINCEPDEQPPYWRPIIDNEPNYENLP